MLTALSKVSFTQTRNINCQLFSRQQGTPPTLWESERIHLVCKIETNHCSGEAQFFWHWNQTRLYPLVLHYKDTLNILRHTPVKALTQAPHHPFRSVSSMWLSPDWIRRTASPFCTLQRGPPPQSQVSLAQTRPNQLSPTNPGAYLLPKIRREGEKKKQRWESEREFSCMVGHVGSEGKTPPHVCTWRTFPVGCTWLFSPFSVSLSLSLSHSLSHSLCLTVEEESLASGWLGRLSGW